MKSLGPEVIDWMEAFLGAPDGREGTLRLNREQKRFLVKWYAVDESGGRLYRRGLLSRAKGWGRSPFAAAWIAVEALGPVRFDGWDADGWPVGRPWHRERRVLCQLLAVSLAQTRNAWTSLQDMLTEGPVADMCDVGETMVHLPHRGRIEFATSSALTREGNRPVAAVLDQSESWTRGNRGDRLAATVRRNLGKTGGSSLELPNSFRPGSNSVSEMSFRYWEEIQAGTAVDEGLLVDDRRAPDDFQLGPNVTDDELIDVLRVVYGCSAADPHGCGHGDCPPGWVPLPRIVREIQDLGTEPEDSEQFYLNRPVSEPGSYFTAEMIEAITRRSA